MFDACRVTRGAHTNIFSCHKNFFLFSFGCEQFNLGRPFGFRVINVCVHEEHYKTPCILTSIAVWAYCMYS
jgi:hypothetical protein